MPMGDWSADASTGGQRGLVMSDGRQCVPYDQALAACRDEVRGLAGGWLAGTWPKHNLFVWKAKLADLLLAGPEKPVWPRQAAVAWVQSPCAAAAL